MDSLPELPPDTIPLQHQVSGHFYGNKKSKFGLLQRCSTGDVLKPLNDNRRGPSELRFYLNAFSDDAPENLRALRPFMAALLGTYEYNGISYLVLENVVHPYDHPCVADIKVGRITYDFEASQEDIDKSHRRYPPLSDIGFQLLGWQIYRPEDNLYEYHDKICGRSMNKDDLIYAIAHFYGAPKSDYRKVVRSALERLTVLEQAMAKQTGFVFISSSLLIVYEGGQENEPDQHFTKRVDIRVVDLPKVFKVEQYVDQNGLEENFLFGLRSYMDYLQRILDDKFVYENIDKLNIGTRTAKSI